MSGTPGNIAKLPVLYTANRIALCTAGILGVLGVVIAVCAGANSPHALRAIVPWMLAMELGVWTGAGLYLALLNRFVLGAPSASAASEQRRTGEEALFPVPSLHPAGQP